MKAANYALVAFLTLAVLAVALSMGYHQNAFGIAIMTSLVVLVLGEGIYFINSKPGVAFLFTYISLLSLVIISLSLRTLEVVYPWSTYYIVFSSITSVILAGYNLMLSSTLDLLPQVFMIWSFPLMLQKEYSFLGLTLIVAGTAFTRNFRSLVGYALSYLALYSPLIVTAYVLTSIRRVPHVALLDVTGEIGQVRYVYLATGISIILGLLLASAVGSASARLRGKSESLLGCLARSLTSALPPVLYILTLIFLTSLVPALEEVLPSDGLLRCLAPSLGLVLPISAAIDVYGFHKTFKTLREEVGLELERLRKKVERRLKILAEVVTRGTPSREFKKVVEEYHQLYRTLVELENKLRTVSELRLLRDQKGYLAQLSKLEEELQEKIIETYLKATSDIYNAISFIKAYDRLDESLVEELHVMGRPENLGDLGDHLARLNKLGVRLCKELRKIKVMIAEDLRKILQYTVTAIEEPKCSEEAALKQLRGLLNSIRNLLQDYEDELVECFSRLIQLRNALTKLAERLELSRTSHLNSAARTLNYVESLKEVSETVTEPLAMVKYLSTLGEKTEEFIREFPELTKRDLTYLAELTRFKSGKIAEVLTLEAIWVSSEIERYLQEVSSILRYGENYCDLFTKAREVLPGVLEAVFREMKVIAYTTSRTSLIPLAFDLIDYLRRVKGEVKPSDLPFTEDISGWLIKLYSMRR